MLVDSVAHALAFAFASTILLAAASRVAASVTESLPDRLVIAGTVAGLSAVLHALLLGVVGLGADPWALLAASLASLVAARRWTVKPVDPLGSQVRRTLAAWSSRSWVLAGAAGGTAAAWTGFLVWHPFLGVDAVIYHLAQPAMWIHDGRPGSMNATNVALPHEAYPRTGEVLFSWAVSLSRTPAVTSLLMAAVLLLTAVSTWVVLRRLGASRRWAALAGAALLLSPVALTQITGPNTDILSFCWTMCTAAIALLAARETRALPLVLPAAALAVSTKTTTVPVVVVIVLCTAIHLRSRLRQQGAILAFSGLVAVPLALLWPVINWVRYGAPLYPFNSLPSGPELPYAIQLVRASFATDPVASLEVATPRGYLVYFGGCAVLGAGVVAVAGAAAVLRCPRRRVLLALAALAALATVAWSLAPFTGWSGTPGTESLVAGAVRYLLPGAGVYTATVAAATAGSQRVAGLAKLFVLMALVVDVWAVRDFPPPYRPPGATIFIALAVGAACGGAVGLRRRARASSEPAGTRAGAAVACLALALAMATVASGHGFVARSVSAQSDVDMLSSARVLAHLNSQPSWRNGHADVDIGPVSNALYAGPAFNHVIRVVPTDTGCGELRARVREAWLVLTDVAPGQTLGFGLDYRKRACLAQTLPSFVDGATAVYAPTG